MLDATLHLGGNEIDAHRLGHYLRARMPDADGPLEVRRFPEGHSNLTYLVRSGRHEWILRRPPPGALAPGAHDVAREHRILGLLAPVFPLAPRALLQCEDSSVIGAPFVLLEYRHGVVVRSALPPGTPADRNMRCRIGEAMVDALAALHAVDWRQAGLAHIGRPQGFLGRQVARWSERYERVRSREQPAIGILNRWLTDNLPASPAATLLHNDFKLDNVMLDPADLGRVTAVLDWELATVGDPLVDLGVLLCHWPEAGDPGIRRELVGPVTTEPGFPTRAELVARYAALTRRDVSRMRFYETFALYRVAIIEQQIFDRYRRGETTDSRFAAFEERASRLAQAALDVARSDG